jgi:inner membrane protein
LQFAVLGSQLPDLDTTTSTIGKIFFPISSWIENRYPHRTITHSLLATAFIAVVAIACGHFLLGNTWQLIALPIGHLLACFSDCFTKQGVQLFWPEPVWAISVSNPRRRLKTGGAGELWVLASAIALLIFGIYLATGGGITQKVSQTLGLKDGLVELYNQKAATNLMYAEIKGVWVRDRTNADGKYLILDNQGSEFIVTNGQGIYKTNEHIISNKLTTTIGRPASTEIKNITFNDEDPIPKLEELKLAYPNNQLFIFGELTIDFPEDIELPIYANQIERISLTGNTLKFNYANLKEVITILNEQYAIGNLIIKVIEHTPSKSKIIDGDSLAPRSF